MGSVSVDLHSNEHKLEFEYPLETPQGVNAFLSNIHHIRSSAIDKGDFDAIILLVDFEIAYSKINVTARQREAVQLVFFADLTQREAGEIMGISQQAVQQLLHSVVVKISEQYGRDLNGVRGGDNGENISTTVE